jgi:hypothetical protein
MPEEAPHVRGGGGHRTGLFFSRFFFLVRWVVGDLIGDVREEEALIPSQFCGTDGLPPIVYMLI